MRSATCVNSSPAFDPYPTEQWEKEEGKMEFGLGLTQPINYHLKKYRYPAWSLSYLLVASLVSSSITHLAHGQALLLANQVAGCFLQSVIQRKDLE